MKLRLFGWLFGALASAISFVGFFAVASITLGRLGLINAVTGLVVGSSLVASVLVFRAVHDWTVLRWSNEPDPFLFGSFDLDRTLRRWRRVL